MTESGRPIKICFTANMAWNLANFRLNHMRTLQDLGCEVHAAAPPDRHVDAITAAGITFHPWEIQRRSMNPCSEWISFLKLKRIYRLVRPDLVHHYTVKAVLYGTTAARLAGVPATVNAVTGLPYIVISQNRGVIRRLGRWAAMKWYGWCITSGNAHAVLQNQDDLDLLASFVPQVRQHCTLTPGSGVDLKRFSPTPPADNPVPVVLFVGRLLREKGFFELIDAVKLLRRQGVRFQFVVCGGIDPGNRSSASQEQSDQWVADGLIDRIERLDDVRPALAAADLVVLPSWREGTPRSLLEAMAMSRPIVTTDVPGCREVVRDEINGKLVPVREPKALADGLGRLIESPELRRQMGRAGRQFAEQRFDERQVIEQNIEAYRTLLERIGRQTDFPGPRLPSQPVA
ncbi:MAG: glycosyltransferase family 4 protein [Pirellulales bacterium]|nr:glycosyltransferase family 4 protein [Pirellulales bacterium]